MASSEGLMRIVLIGKTGVGKSATGNTILGEKCFTSKKAFQSQTGKAECHTRTRFGKRLLVVDTPGLYDTEKDVTNENIMQEIKKSFVQMSPGPHAVILVVGIGRYGEQERETANQFIHWFGKDVMKYVFVVFTGLDDLDEDETFESTMETATPELKKLLELCNDRYMPFANKDTSTSPNQVEELVSMIDKNIKGDYKKFYTNKTFEKIEKAIQESGQTREEFVDNLLLGTAVAIALLAAPIWLPFYAAKKLIEKIF